MGSRRKQREAAERVAWNQEGWLPTEERIETARSPFGGVLKWAAPLAVAGVGSMIDSRRGMVAAIVFSIVAGAFVASVTPRKPSRKEPSAMPPMAYAWMFGGCFWITAASAFLVAALLRTVGVAGLEAAGACYVVFAGSCAFAGMAIMASDDRRRALREGSGGRGPSA